jgi:hypothetical protein
VSIPQYSDPSVFELTVSAGFALHVFAGRLHGPKQPGCCLFWRSANQARAIEAAKLQQLVSKSMMAFGALFHGKQTCALNLRSTCTREKDRSTILKFL